MPWSLSLCSESPVPNRDVHIVRIADQVDVIIGEKTTFSRFLPPLKVVDRPHSSKDSFYGDKTRFLGGGLEIMNIMDVKEEEEERHIVTS